MKSTNKIIIALVILLLLLIGGGAIYINSLKQDLKDEQFAHRKEILRNDKLTQISENQYRKLVADTLRARDLEKIVKDLGIELDKAKNAKPKIVYRTKIVVKEVEKEVDSVKIENDTLQVEDYYPQKDKYFIRYQNTIDLLKKKGNSRWSFNPVDISIVLSQRSDGIWSSDIKVPEFMTVGEVDVQAIPLTAPKPDNFGWIAGGGIGTSLEEGGDSYLRVNFGVRYKKLSLLLGGSTNKTVDANINVEF